MSAVVPEWTTKLWHNVLFPRANMFQWQMRNVYMLVWTRGLRSYAVLLPLWICLCGPG